MKACAGHVYVMERSTDGHLKVGFSNSPPRRLKELDRRQGHLRVVFTTDAFFVNAEAIERAAHKLLEMAGKRVEGEWFRVTLQEAVDAIERASQIADGLSPRPALPPKAGTQINIRVDDKLLVAIERIRQNTSPIPTVSDVVRDAILEKEKRDLAKKVARR